MIPLLTGLDAGVDGDFHEGQKGGWWGFVHNLKMTDVQAQCDLPGYPILEWVPDATPVPPDAVTAWKMAATAAKVIPVTTPTLTHPVTATVTWNVTWTDTASPDSPPQTNPTLGPLTLTTQPLPVTVKEIETTNN